jgi:hypothetical protein
MSRKSVDAEEADRKAALKAEKEAIERKANELVVALAGSGGARVFSNTVMVDRERDIVICIVNLTFPLEVLR